MKTATFLRHEQLIPGVWQSFFEPSTPLAYIAGQYLDIRLPGVIDDPRGNGRTFSLTSLPSDTCISFVYRYDEPASPYKQRLLALQPGDVVQLGDVMGDVVLPKLSSQPLIFVAGGIGMASFTASLQLLATEQPLRTVRLFYCLRHPYDDAFAAQLATFPFTEVKRYIRPNYLNAQAIADVMTPESLVYLSGSEPFVTGLRDSLHALGIADTQLIFDFFDGYSEL